MSNEIIKNRYEFVYFFDVENGNPNGDPDAGNMPRIDPETNHGIVTDVCLKRKVRNFVQMSKNDAPPFKIFVKEKAVLNQLIEEPYGIDDGVIKAVEEWQEWQKNKKTVPRPKHHYEDLAKLWMCGTYYDTRAFGAVMTTGDQEMGEKTEGKSKIKKTAGQVRGPIQFGFARSVEPIVPLECSITRMAVTNEKDLEKERTMGRKHIIPYALYRVHGYICPNFAIRDLERKIYGTGFTDGEKSDLELFWEALEKMFWCDASSARQPMCARKLIIFKHESPLGNAPAHKLFDLVKVARATDQTQPARAFSDYKITIDKSNVPAGVILEEKI